MSVILLDIKADDLFPQAPNLRALKQFRKFFSKQVCQRNSAGWNYKKWEDVISKYHLWADKKNYSVSELNYTLRAAFNHRTRLLIGRDDAEEAMLYLGDKISLFRIDNYLKVNKIPLWKRLWKKK